MAPPNDNKKKPIYVTVPYLPPLEEFQPYLEQIWANKWLTNAGPFHQLFEQELAEYLGVEHLALFNNGTLALIVALQALHITGEVITTPYSFVATAHSLLWNNLKPVFVDIDPATCNLDPAKIDAAITPQTTAILPVHCYGTPCDVEAIQHIADIYGLKVIYDAAHAFGVRYRGESILKHGDLSIMSFHATKMFTTFEGGAIICPDKKTKQRIDYLKNFGFADEVTVTAPGINAKMNEFSAALGLLQLKHIKSVLDRRREVADCYREALHDVTGIRCLGSHADATLNYSYFPIFIGPDYRVSRDQLYTELRAQNIYARRYFYPLITTMPMYRHLPSANLGALAVASRTAQDVLCLPIYPELELDRVKAIADIIADQ